MKNLISKLAILVITTFGLIATAQAGAGYNGQCPSLAGKYVSDQDHSPLVITEQVQDDQSIAYGYGSYGADEILIADGKTRSIEGATITVSCAQNAVIKSYTAEGVRGQMIFQRQPNGTLVIANKGMINTSQTYSLSN